MAGLTDREAVGRPIAVRVPVFVVRAADEQEDEIAEPEEAGMTEDPDATDAAYLDDGVDAAALADGDEE